jgi:hypothetical protein
LKDRFTPELKATVTNVAADTTQTDKNTPPFTPTLVTTGPAQLEHNRTRYAGSIIQTDKRTPLSSRSRWLISWPILSGE